MEKHYTAAYLQYVKNQGIDIKNEYDLFIQETDLWTTFASQYTKFLTKGFLMSSPIALFRIKHMYNLLEDIVSIEQTILD